jgi:CheY-like chemotaxis protein
MSEGGESLRRARVLIVDDEPALASTLGLLMRDETDVTVVTSGEAAVELVRSGRDFDAILSDLTMPGVSGMDLYARVREMRPGLEARLIFMTGGAFTPRAAAFVASIANPTIEKPFEVSAVLDLVRRVAAK